MTSVLTWNIQNGLGVNGDRSLERIAQVIHSHGDPDVLCLQEVSRHLVLDHGVAAPDQVSELAQLFPEYEPVFGAAYDIVQRDNGQRAQYGNLILSRLPVLSRFSHPLPQPPCGGEMQMPRQAMEVSVMAHDGPLRVMTTHLAFHSATERLAQIKAFKSIHEAIVQVAEHPPKQLSSGPYQAFDRASRAVLCGDFNCLPESDEWTELFETAPTSKARLQDAWRVLSGETPHKPTCGIFDQTQWPQGGHCRDYFAVGGELASQIIGMVTDTNTDASDHQPIRLTLS
ncbi:MAG: endonuclease/exonuclease/phosphatase family protein [Burkholderiaceae bacterium]